MKEEDGERLLRREERRERACTRTARHPNPP